MLYRLTRPCLLERRFYLELLALPPVNVSQLCLELLEEWLPLVLPLGLLLPPLLLVNPVERLGQLDVPAAAGVEIPVERRGEVESLAQELLGAVLVLQDLRRE